MERCLSVVGASRKCCGVRLGSCGYLVEALRRWMSCGGFLEDR
jgi:hypothetical protein